MAVGCVLWPRTKADALDIGLDRDRVGDRNEIAASVLQKYFMKFNL